MEESRLDRIEKEVELFLRGVAELRESQKQTDEQLRKTDEQLRKTDEQLRKTDEQLRESQQKTDEQFRRTDEKIEKMCAQLGDLGFVQGQVAEDLFYRNVRCLFKKREMEFSSVIRNMKKKGIAEYDIVAVNDDKILVIEVKNKLERRMVDNFITKRIPKFREVFPEYRDYDLIGGVGSLVMKDDVSRYAEKQGLYVLTQKDDGGAALINPKNFKAKEF